MQCTRYIPLRYLASDQNEGAFANGSTWPSFSPDPRYGEHRLHSPSFYSNQCIRDEKWRIRWIMQNHEATFQHQLQELHRLYKRQKDLMNEMKLRATFPQHVLEPSQCFGMGSHLQRWLYDCKLSEQLTTRGSECFSAEYHKLTVDRHLPVNMFSEEEQGKTIRMDYVSDNGALKERPSFNLNEERKHFVFDLNQPVVDSSSLDPSAGRLVNCGGYSDACSMVIDLNSLPPEEADPPISAQLAAETLVMFSSSSFTNVGDCGLCWFADIAETEMDDGIDAEIKKRVSCKKTRKGLQSSKQSSIKSWGWGTKRKRGAARKKKKSIKDASY